MTKEEIKSEYYMCVGRGDFQNETDLLDIDAAWDYFSKKLDLQNKELIERVKELESQLAEKDDLIHSLEAQLEERNIGIQALEQHKETINRIAARMQEIDKEYQLKIAYLCTGNKQRKILELQSEISSLKEKHNEFKDYLVSSQCYYGRSNVSAHYIFEIIIQEYYNQTNKNK